MFNDTDVLKMFNVKETPTLLSGGQGTTWKAGNIILKPFFTPEEANWLSETMEILKQMEDGFRVSKPIRGNNGLWIFKGWTASEFVEGEHRKGNWKEKFETCSKFHKALQSISKPDLISEANHPWAIADRVAWGESQFICHEKLKPALDLLFNHIIPINLPSQLIHGDFTENILFKDGLAPAVIDLSPYWRPAGFAKGVIIADALVWGGADTSIFKLVIDEEMIQQLAIRAEIRRIMELDGAWRQFGNAKALDDISVHLPKIQMILDWKY